MRQTRVLVAGMQGMLGDIVRGTVDGAADMTVVGARHDGESVEAAVQRTDADVVVLDAGHAELAGDPPPMLVRRARALSLLAVDSERGEGTLYTLRPVRRALGEICPSRLLAAIRQRAATTHQDPTPDQAD